MASDSTLVTIMARVGDHAPLPQEHAEGCEERAGQHEQQVAGDAVHADGGDGLAADHDEAGDDDERAGDALRRQPLVQHDGRRARRPSSAAVDGWMMPPWPSGTSGKPE